MSSLRPLATIALLGAVGVFLYMKINDSEPKLSPEMEEWSTSTLDIGSPDAAAPGVTTAGTAAPTYGSPTSGDAPPYVAAQVNPAPAATTTAPPAGDAAPPWTPGALNVDTQPPASTPDSSPVARSADSPAMPAMPGMPGEAATTTPDTDRLTAAAAAAAAAGTAGVAATQAIDTPSTSPKTSMFSAARVAVQGALDRGELAQALLLLSDWYDDPSLTSQEAQEVNDLLSQLAGSVIYEGPPAHRLLPAHVVQAGETLEAIADKYEIPSALLAKINSVPESKALTPGQALKVVQGPFSALIDLSERKMTLMLDRRYAGVFALEIDPAANVEEGNWKVDQKLLTPGGGGVYAAVSASEDRSLLLANLADPTNDAAVLRGPGNPDPIGAAPKGRVIRLKSGDVNDIYDILSVGSKVTIRR